MRKILIMMAAAALAMVGCKQADKATEQGEEAQTSTVYMIEEISPEALVRLFDEVNFNTTGRVAVKISTGEAGGHNYLKPELIGPLVQHVHGQLVECNTAYAGSRMDTEAHRRVIEDHGFNSIGGVDIMDAEGDMPLPVRDTTYMRYNRVGRNLENYDVMINLAHFKGHQMAGFGGVLKNASIGVASSAGKAYIHSNGATEDVATLWQNIDPANQDKFLECMATAAASVHDYMEGRVLYINVMNNMSIDCDCNGNPTEPKLKDMGILASKDPVALDQACLDLVYNHQNTEGDDASSLIARIEKQHGVHVIEHAEKMELGSRKYHIVMVD